MKVEPTFTAIIYVGFRVGRTVDPSPRFYDVSDARKICRDYVDSVGLCVTLTPTEYIYVHGGEPGCAIGLINYPRFPSTPAQIREHALALGERLRIGLEQFKVSVVFHDETVMLGEDAH